MNRQQAAMMFGSLPSLLFAALLLGQGLLASFSATRADYPLVPLLLLCDLALLVISIASFWRPQGCGLAIQAVAATAVLSLFIAAALAHGHPASLLELSALYVLFLAPGNVIRTTPRPEAPKS